VLESLGIGNEILLIITRKENGEKAIKVRQQMTEENLGLNPVRTTTQ
jgi:hypothetical protein